MALAPRDTTGFGRSDLHIPSVINPPGRRCITLSIPDDPEHVRLLAGVLHPLTKPYNWTNGTEEEKDEISSVYAQMYLDIDWLGECMPTPITNMRITDCGIEVLYGLDPTWQPVTDSEFIPKDGSCNAERIRIVNPIDEHGSLTIQKAADGGSSRRLMELKRANGQNVLEFGDLGQITMRDHVIPTGFVTFQPGVNGSNHVFQGLGGRSWLWVNDGFMGFNYSNSNGVGVGASAVLGLAQFSVLIRDPARRGINVRETTAQANDSLMIENVSAERIAAIRAGGSALFTNYAIQKKTSTTWRDTALFEAAWDIATDAVRVGRFVLSAIDYNSTKEIIRGRADGTQAMIGLLGATPQPRLTITGDTYGIPALDQVIDALALFGLVTDASAPGTVPWATLGDIPAPFELPPPVAVGGSWQGNEAGKILSIALDQSGYIVDQTTEGDPIPFNAQTLNLRCRAAATADWIVYQWYINVGAYMAMVQPSAYDPPLYGVFDRWVDACELTEAPLDPHFDDLYDSWATQIWTEIHDGVNDDNWDAHVADLITYLPDIRQAFYCGANDDGIITAAGLLDIQTLLFADNYTGSVPQDIYTWFYTFFQYFTAQQIGYATANAIYSSYTLAYDCADFTACTPDEPDWCKRYNAAVSAYTPPFVLVTGDHVFAGTGSGWKTDDAGDLRIEFPYPTISLTFRYTVTIPTAAIAVEFGSIDTVYTVTLATAPGTYDETITIPEANRADGWYFEASCNPEVCTVSLKWVEDMSGTGTEPTEGNDCI
jgi:hypothetical protein